MNMFKSILMFIVLCLPLTLPLTLSAHQGHSHNNITEFETQGIGVAHIKKLIEKKKLDASWSEASYVFSKKKTFGKHKEWVVVFSNPKGETDKKDLHVFITLAGKVKGANFTGK